MLKILVLVIVCTGLALSGCQNWPVPPISYNTPPVPPSRTPLIRTPTPFITSPTSITPTETSTSSGQSVTLTPVELTPSATLTPTPPLQSGAVDALVLGCETSLDLTHGMGEVTNAYVTISNSTAAEVVDLCATLRGLDEGRPHPDKTKCVPSLPSGFQVTFKLTVDTTYQEGTPIQIDVTSGDTLVVRAGRPACTDIGLVLPSVGELGVLKPIP